MKKVLMSIEFTEEGDEIGVNTKFPSGGVPAGQIFDLVGQAIKGLVMTARKIGEARGLTEDQVDSAIFGTAEEVQ